MRSALYIFSFFIATVATFLSGYAQDSVRRPVHPRRHTNPLPLVPQFPGGKDSLSLFIKNHTKYPSSARKHGINGTVQVTFIVTKAGEITKARIYKSLGYGCDEEALRIVKIMPHWKPGMMGRDTMEMDYHVDIPFGTETPKQNTH